MTAPTPLAKLHATGNDFLVVTATVAERFAGAPAAASCDRHTGVGADGLIVMGDGRDGADVTMTLFNADGGRAEMSGNGIRCLAWAAVRAGVPRPDPARLVVDTDGGRRTLDLDLDGSGAVIGATCDMGPVIFDVASIPVTTATPFGLTAEFHGIEYEGDAAGMGNPHLVLLVDDPATASVAQHGPRLERDPRFPQRTNVEFIAPTPGEPDAITMRVWERGVGETRSCGTGACAAAAVAHRRELVGKRVTVHVPGGDLRVTLGETIRLGGPVVHVFDVTIDLDTLTGERTMSQRHLNRGRQRLTATEVDLGVVVQRALLVGTGFGTHSLEEAEASLEELALLADTAGAEVVAVELQRRGTPDPATYVGKGKVDELRGIAEGLDVDVVIFDDELSPAQQRNLERLLAVDVVDRVALILDIFAQHATSGEGMVQVELAQLRYRLPRLRGRGNQLSQQGAGIGTRGPGETQLEVDRRRIQRRITKLEAELAELGRTRATQRKARHRRSITTVALVGYTNVGKSTLLNRLTHADVLVEDRLFSTLDPATRRLRLPGGETVLLSDTVGFVRRLPHQLVEAFRSTLEEVGAADFVLHLVDASAPEPEDRVRAVRTVLREIDAGDLPELVVLTKADVASEAQLADLRHAHPDAVTVSARSGAGVPELLAELGDRLRALDHPVELRIPYDRGDVVAALHREGEVLVEVHEEGGTRVRVRLPDAVASRYRGFAVGAPG